MASEHFACRGCGENTMQFEDGGWEHEANCLAKRAEQADATYHAQLDSCQRAKERLESKLSSATDEIGTHVRAYMDQFERANALQDRLEEVSKAAELISSKDSELRRQNIELRDANRDLRAQFQDIANQTGPRLTKMREERDAALLRLGSALKFVDYIEKRYQEGWDEPITERFYNEAKALLDDAWGRELAATVVEKHEHEYDQETLRCTKCGEHYLTV